jgi:hypothetical protein
MLATLCIGAGLLSSHALAAGAEGCSGFRFDLGHELKLFDGKAQATTAGQTEAKPDTLYAVALAAQSGVRFAAEPGKLTVDDGSYAGLLRYTPAKNGLLRVTIDEAAWVDVVVDGATIQSSSHTGSAGCKLLHKSVQFEVRRGVPVIVQISGSTTPEVRLTLTQP